MRDDYLKIFEKNWDHFIVLFEKSQDVFWVTNKDYSVQLYVNPSFDRIWGYNSKVLYETPLFWLETIVPEDKARLAATSRLPHQCRTSPYKEKYRIIRPDGRVRWILDYTYPIFNHLRECVGYAGIAQEITHLSDLTTDSQIAINFLPKLAEKMDHSAFWVRDPTLEKQLYISKGFEKIWGRPVEYVYQNPEKWQETIIPEDRRNDKENILNEVAQKGGKAQFSNHYRIIRPTGEIRWIRDISFPIFDNVANVCIGFAGIAEDVTHEKLYEIKLCESKEKAEIANVAKSNFMASMSHDFRTPLNGLLGMAEILRAGPCYPEQKEYIDAILHAGNSLLGLVEDIINFVALEFNKLPLSEDIFDLEKLVEEIILNISPQAHEKKVEIIFNYSELVPKIVCGDSNRIRRILMNLIHNAVKFTSQGHVLINIELHKQLRKKYWLRFMVEDTGIGISPENFDYIFGSFNRIDPSYKGRYKGTGLGLTIVKQFIEDLGGSIKLKSELNQGSIFYCNIPFQSFQKKSLPLSANHFHIKILIVDDFKKRALTFIKQFGLQNTDIANSETCLESVFLSANERQPYDMIIVDDEIEADVLALPSQLNPENHSLMLLISGKKTQQSYKELKKYGYFECITKPLQPLIVTRIFESARVMIMERASGKEHPQKPLSVLLIEDDPLTQKITKWMLEELQCKVNIANTASKALELLENSYDLILLDIGLPDMDGIQLAKTIRSMKVIPKEIPIVALTAHVLEKDKEKCLAAGMNEFLKKPLFIKDLKKILLKIF